MLLFWFSWFPHLLAAVSWKSQVWEEVYESINPCTFAPTITSNPLYDHFHEVIKTYSKTIPFLLIRLPSERMFQIFISYTFGDVLIFIQIVFLSSLYWFVLVPVQLLNLNYSYLLILFLLFKERKHSHCYSSFYRVKHLSLSHAIY